MSYAIKTLELNKILECARYYAHSNKAKEMFDTLVPYTNALEIENLLSEVEEARGYLVSYGEPNFDGLTNQDGIIRRLDLDAVLAITEILGIRDLLICTRSIISYYKESIKPRKITDFLTPYFTILDPVTVVLNMIDNTMSNNGEIYDTASDALLAIRKKIKNLELEVRSKMNELLQTKSKMLQDNIIVMRNGRMCLPIKAEYKNTFKGIIHDESASGTTAYIEPYSAFEISNKVLMAKEEEKAEINRILTLLSDKIRKYSVELGDNFNNLCQLDFIYAKAKYAHHTDCFMPKLNEMGRIVIKKGRHPLLDAKTCVPLDIHLGDDFKAIIITGPNTGGKTVALKTVGLLTLMTQCGLLIPAEAESEIAVFNNVYADIGDEQSIEQSLSSFSSHMTNVIKMLNEFDDNSLFLLDELGSGTDPKEGSNLAISIVEYLLSFNARIICTTHYADLKAFAYNHDDIINASVEFDVETLRPTYKLLLGIPGRSNAITIASHLGLNQFIIDKALNLNESNTSDLSVMLAKLDDKNTELEAQIKRFEEDNRILSEKIKELEEREIALDSQADEIIRKAKKEAEKIILKAKEDSEELLEKLDSLSKEAFKEHQLAEIKHTVHSLGVEADDLEIFHEFEVGETVVIKEWDRIGRITKINGEKITVVMGNLSMEFKKSDLKVHKGPVTQKTVTRKKQPSEGPRKRDAKLELDLRGKRYEEVAYELDKFIDSAYLAGMGMVYIIHGFGTGAVRKAVYEYLKKCPYVKSTRYGGEGEGLQGVTVVTLK